MATVTPEVHAEMLNRVKEGKFAYPAINVTSSQTFTAALQGLTEARSDGIIQMPVGGTEYVLGSTVKDRVAGSPALAAYACEVVKNYSVAVALHTDRCAKQNIDSWVRPLFELEVEEVRTSRLPLFQSHMWDGSAVPLAENLEIARELLALSQAANTILEIGIGVVGDEEDGVVGKIDEKLYITTEDALVTVEALGLGENGRYLTALTSGNVHGVYKLGHVKLRPEILGTIQEKVAVKAGWKNNHPFDLVTYGGPDSTADETALVVANGVIKMSVDTDTQYAFTRPVAEHTFRKYGGVLKIDGEVGNKKDYDPRSQGKLIEVGMAARVSETYDRLGSVGTKMN